MKIRSLQITTSSFVPAAFLIALSVQACGGVGPQADSTAAASGEDLSVLGFKLPEPAITISDRDASVTINPVALAGEILPVVTVIDPIQPVNKLIGFISPGLTATVQAGGVAVSVTAPALPIPGLPDLFDGGIQIIGP
jgi:hypothetical protein